MIDNEKLAAFAAKNYPEDAGSMVPLDLLKAWLFEEHMHMDGASGPLVLSMDLQRWAERVAN